MKCWAEVDPSFRREWNRVPGREADAFLLVAHPRAPFATKKSQ